MPELPGHTLGRNLRPQSASTQGLRQNQVGSVGQDPTQILDGLINQYVAGFQDYHNSGERRLRDQVQRDLVQRGIQSDATGVDILNRNLTDYNAQQNASLANALVPLYTAMSSLAEQARESQSGRDFMARESQLGRDFQGRESQLGRDFQLDVLGRQNNYNSNFAREQINNQLDYQKRIIPINSEAFSTAYALEQKFNPPNNYNPMLAAVNQMAAQQALNTPSKYSTLDPPKGPWDPSQGAPGSGDYTGGYTYNPNTGTWGTSNAAAPSTVIPQTKSFDLTDSSYDRYDRG